MSATTRSSEAPRQDRDASIRRSLVPGGDLLRTRGLVAKPLPANVPVDCPKSPVIRLLAFNRDHRPAKPTVRKRVLEHAHRETPADSRASMRGTTVSYSGSVTARAARRAPTDRVPLQNTTSPRRPPVVVPTSNRTNSTGHHSAQPDPLTDNSELLAREPNRDLVVALLGARNDRELQPPSNSASTSVSSSASPRNGARCRTASRPSSRANCSS